MSKFEFSGNDLIERWEIRNFELFNYFKKGLQPYDASTGRMIVDLNTDYGKKWSPLSTPCLFTLKSLIKKRRNRSRAVNCYFSISYKNLNFSHTT